MIRTRLLDLPIPSARAITACMRAPFRLALVVSLVAMLACRHGEVPSEPGTGSLAVTISGLPAGSDALVTITGPQGFTRTIDESQTLTNLAAGSYTVVAEQVSVSGATYAPARASQPATVDAGGTPAAVRVVYDVVTGRLTINISGLPTGANADVVVSGPSGFRETVAASQTLGNLAPGSYTITATSIVAACATWVPSVPSQEIPVEVGGSATVAIAYTAPAPGSLNLCIQGLYITQSTQTFAGSVPLVQGRDGFLRVFVQANRSNTATPRVRVRFYTGSVLTSTITILPPGTSVPTTINEGTLSSSWNAEVPASLIQPNLTILADVDPDGLITEESEDDNQYPASGSPRSFTVRSVPALSIRFVPVVQSANGLTGNVTAANKDNYLSFMRRIYPIPSYDSDVRSPYTTSAPALQSDDANRAWGTVLDELHALRVAEGSSRYYYGVVRTGYSSGVAGIGYIGQPTALGWDAFQVGEIAAHELGHNFGRRHAPCDISVSVDSNYPYPNGRIGVYGYDLTTGTLKSASLADVMGYCQNQWVSDYTYVAVLNSLASSAAASVVGAGAQPSLLVWGRISNGRLVLEPAFKVTTRPSLPERPGPYRLDGFDASGVPLFSLSFAGQEVADERGGEKRHFAFAIPLTADLEARLTTLRLSSGVARVAMSSSSRPSLPGGVAARLAAPAVSSLGGGRVTLSWDASAHPMALVRDARTGEILSFARRGTASVWTDGEELDVVLSDGVRSHNQRVRVSGR